MLDHVVKGLLRRHVFVNVDCGGRVADTERRAVVYLFARDAERYCHSLRVGVRENVQAVVIAADA
jgi:hypothetical protein